MGDTTPCSGHWSIFKVDECRGAPRQNYRRIKNHTKWGSTRATDTRYQSLRMTPLPVPLSFSLRDRFVPSSLCHLALFDFSDLPWKFPRQQQHGLFQICLSSFWWTIFTDTHIRKRALKTDARFMRKMCSRNGRPFQDFSKPSYHILLARNDTRFKTFHNSLVIFC